MNQIDYKAIAGIIKKVCKDFVHIDDDLGLQQKAICKGLADYFESENRYDRVTQAGDFKGVIFNRKQFLKL